MPVIFLCRKVQFPDGQICIYSANGVSYKDEHIE